MNAALEGGNTGTEVLFKSLGEGVMCSTETGYNCVGQNEEGSGESMCKIDVATEGCIYGCSQRVNRRGAGSRTERKLWTLGV